MVTKAAPVEVKRTAGKEAAAPESKGRSGGYPLTSLRDEINGVFDRFFGAGWPARVGDFSGALDWDPFPSFGWRGGLGSVELSPSAEVSETENQYEITVELAGMDEKDIDLTVTDDVVTLRGEKKADRETKEKDYHLTERSYGAFRRSFALPSGVDVAKIKAGFSKGVLTLTLPKTREAKSKTRKIPVKST